MYYLEVEMKNKGINRRTLAQALNIGETTIGLKLNGKSPITLEEAMAIKYTLGSSRTIEELFAEIN